VAGGRPSTGVPSLFRLSFVAGNIYTRAKKFDHSTLVRTELRKSLALGWLARLNSPGLSAFLSKAMFLGTFFLSSSRGKPGGIV